MDALLPDCPGCVHDHGDSDNTDRCSDDVETVGPETIEDDSPDKGADDEDPAICGEDSSEMLEGLEGGNEPVEAEGDDTCSHQHHAPLLSHPLPYQPGATDLGDGGDYEQSNRFQDRHDVDCRTTKESCVTTVCKIPQVPKFEETVLMSASEP